MLKPSFTTHVVSWKGNLIIVKNVPCEECQQCGEKYFSDDVAIRLEAIVNATKAKREELVILDYFKASIPEPLPSTLQCSSPH